MGAGIFMYAQLDRAMEVQQTQAAQTQTEVQESNEPGMLQKGVGAIGDFAKSSTGKILIREVTRGLLGVLGLSGSSRRRK